MSNNVASVDYLQRNGFGVSQLSGLHGLASLGAEGDPAASDLTVPTSTPQSTRQRAQALVAQNPIVFGLAWTMPALLGGAVSGLVAASTMRGAQQGALWAGGGAAAAAGAIMLVAEQKNAGWGFLLGGLGVAGYAAWRATQKARD